MNYERYRITGIAVLLLSLCVFLLIGRGLGARFAGGDGPKDLVVATMNDVRYPRGSIITAEEPGILYLGEKRLFLDLDTQIELVSLNENDPIIRIVQGRAVIDGSLTVQTRETRVKTTGRVSFVHYSWLDELDIGVISGSAQIETPEATLTLETGGRKLKTLAPYTTESIPFSPETSSAKAFYAWVASMSPPPSE